MVRQAEGEGVRDAPLLDEAVDGRGRGEPPAPRRGDAHDAVGDLPLEEAGLVRLAAHHHPLGERARPVAKVHVVGVDAAADLAALRVRDRVPALRALAPRAAHVVGRVLAAERLRRLRLPRVVLWVLVAAAGGAGGARHGGHARAGVDDQLVHRAGRADAHVRRVVAERLEVARDVALQLPPAPAALVRSPQDGDAHRAIAHTAIGRTSSAVQPRREQAGERDVACPSSQTGGLRHRPGRHRDGLACFQRRERAWPREAGSTPRGRRGAGTSSPRTSGCMTRPRAPRTLLQPRALVRRR